jgi:hypothetical protein
MEIKRFYSYNDYLNYLYNSNVLSLMCRFDIKNKCYVVFEGLKGGLKE